MVEITKDGRVYTVPYPCYINDFKAQGWEIVKDLRDNGKTIVEPKVEEIEKEVIVEQPKVEKPIEKSKGKAK